MQIRWFEIVGAEAGGRGLLASLHDGDLTGFGEICLPQAAAQSAALGLLQSSARLLGAVDGRNINSALDAIATVTDRDATIGPPVLAALDIALHDLNGKRRGCPVHAMLGGRYREEIALSHYLGSGTSLPDREPAGAAVVLEYRGGPTRQAASHGVDSAAGWLSGAIGRIGPSVQVDIEASGAFDNPAVARTFIEGLLIAGPRLNLSLIQPLTETDLVGHATLCETLPIPIVLDGSVRSAAAMGQIVRLGAADRVLLSIERVGGLRAAMQVVSLAEAASIGVSSTTRCWTAVGAAAALHLASVLHDTLPARLDNLLVVDGPVAGHGFAVAAGSVKLGDAPGLGIRLHDDALLAFRPVL
ncbi:MAG: mandelate racemase/muconate lactonizing enzyme family protein [Devosia sp.]|uniref:mandelate racemase/muconate lactonizing enzyme family protein n=1 Tax=Devosia sp. TaxID=1871048 RepID=UPI001AD01974|nr:mandelate racemase/muconate lactonizing enzyme family protein [Devosia sp.]MBN9315293.1 mandelate racemase/muconate lactonizing enzyme family protein [Devosia sp.]